LPTYTYRARDDRGQLVRGTMDALSGDEVTAKLRVMGYMATHIALASRGIKVGDFAERIRPIKQQDLIVFYFQLSNLIGAGIPILTALKTIETQVEHRKLKKVIGDTRRSIEAGSLFSASLDRYAGIFGKLFISMVKAGEESGRLDKVLRSYAAYAEGQQELREKVKGALFYPAILFIASIIVILFIVTFLIPQFVDLFSKAGLRLPFITQMLYTAGLMLKNYWYFFMLFLAALIFSAKQYARTKTGRLYCDRLLLKIPVVGVLMRKVYVSRFSRTLATLQISGVSILQSLDITKEVIGNKVMSEVVFKARQAVEQGQKISDPLKVSKEFPLDAVEMIAVGEETGNLEEMLNKIADFYDMSIGFAVKKLTVIIEPVFLVIMGSIIAFIMASMLIPVFDMVKLLRH